MSAIPSLRVASLVLVLASLLPAPVRAQSYTFTHFAGTAGGRGTIDGVGTAARLSQPTGVAFDAAGNLFVADTNNHTIRRISPTGVVTTLAGMAESAATVNGKGGVARMRFPRGIAVAPDGSIVFTEQFHHTVRKISPSGIVTTLAGLSGIQGYKDDTGSAARFNTPVDVAVDANGNAFVADVGNSVIRKITPAGVVSTLAGTVFSAGLVDGTGSAARFLGPAGLAVDATGGLIVADGTAIRRVTSAGEVTTLAGGLTPGSNDGTGPNARFADATGVAITPSGTLYVTDRHNATIRMITSAGEVTTLAGLGRDYSIALPPSTAGSADGTGSAARFNLPYGVAVDAGGNVYVGDSLNHAIRRVTPAGVVTTFAGLPAASGASDGTGSNARFFRPLGLATDPAGNVYVADRDNQLVRKITAAGEVTTLAGSPGVSGALDGTGSGARFHNPTDVAADGAGNVYVADRNNLAIRLIDPSGQVSTFAGKLDVGGRTDGVGSAARFLEVDGVALVGGLLYAIQNDTSDIIRRITTSNATVTPFAGGPGGSSYDGVGVNSWFKQATGIAADASGNVFVADLEGATVRKITPEAVVTTYAGVKETHGYADGSGADVRMGPSDVAPDSSGNVFVTEEVYETIRRIAPDRSVTTIAGFPKYDRFGIQRNFDEPRSTDGTGSGARFHAPHGIATDASGRIYVAETEGHVIRVGQLAIADAATIDAAKGAIGVARQLDTSAQTATAWQWRIVRRPAGSTAEPSSTTIRNPTFTPDVDDLYEFELKATSPLGSSITRVVLDAASRKTDIDGDGQSDALSDGLLILRYLRGIRGPALVNGVVAAGARRTEASEVESFLAANLQNFDVDANGTVQSVTDGELILRYLFGLRGPALVDGAVGLNAKRTTAAAIESYLAGLLQ